MVSVELDVRGVGRARGQAREARARDSGCSRIGRWSSSGSVATIGCNSMRPKQTGEYKRSIELDITPDGDVKLSVKAGHAKPVEARTGVFNKMIREVMSRDVIMKEISRQMEPCPLKLSR